MRRPLAVVTLAALLSVTACSSSGSDAEAGSEGADKTTTTVAKAPVEKTTTTTTVAVPDDPDQALSDAVDATLENPAFTVQSKANLEVGAQQVELTTEGTVDYEALVADAKITIDGGEGQQGDISVLADGETLWVQANGDVGVTVPDGKEWVEGEADRLASSDNFEPVDLIGVLVALRGAKDTEVGDIEEIDGVETQGYSTTLTYDEAVEAAGDDAEAFQSSLSLTADDPVDLDINVWIGEDGIIRRFELTVDAPGGVPLGGTYTVEISGIGDEVEAPEAPDADVVLTGAEAEEILDQLLPS